MKKRLFMMALASGFYLSSCTEGSDVTNNQIEEKDAPLEVYIPTKIGKTVVGDFNGHIAELTEVDGDKYLFGGDVVLDKKDVKVLPGKIEEYNDLAQSRGTYQGKTWTSRIVYYAFITGTPQSVRDIWTNATAAWNRDLGFSFRVRTSTTPDYIAVGANSTGQAYSTSIGRAGGRQDISFDPNSFQLGNMIHEIGHAVGLVHEQKRRDRDTYITVRADLIPTDWKSQYTPCSTCVGVGGYDFGSIMTYGSYLRAAGRNVMFKKDGTTWSAQRNALSSGDKAAINAMYK